MKRALNRVAMVPDQWFNVKEYNIINLDLVFEFGP